MPPDSNPALIPVTVTGDGKLPISVNISGVIWRWRSLMWVKSEKFSGTGMHMQYTCLHDTGHQWQHGRVQIQQECKIHPTGLHQWWYLWNWHGKVIERRAYTWCKNGRDTSVFQSLAASNFFKMAINSAYPEAQNPGVNRRKQNKISPSGQIYYPENLDWMINILWTHTSDKSLQGWKPNHFMPCFQRILLSSKEISPQRDTEAMFAEDEDQPEVETQPGDDPQSKNNGGKEDNKETIYGSWVWHW